MNTLIDFDKIQYDCTIKDNVCGTKKIKLSINDIINFKKNNMGFFHNEKEPSIFIENDFFLFEAWFLNGQLHRIDGPALTFKVASQKLTNDPLKMENRSFYDIQAEKNQWHNLINFNYKLISLVKIFMRAHWYESSFFDERKSYLWGRIYSDYAYEFWVQHDKRHREDGFAVIIKRLGAVKYYCWYNKDKTIFLNDDTPTRYDCINYSIGANTWLLKDKLHRVGGQARYCSEDSSLNSWAYNGRIFKNKESYFNALRKEDKVKCLISPDFFT